MDYKKMRDIDWWMDTKWVRVDDVINAYRNNSTYHFDLLIDKLSQSSKDNIVKQDGVLGTTLHDNPECSKSDSISKLDSAQDFNNQFPSLKHELWSLKEIIIQDFEDAHSKSVSNNDRICNWKFVETHNIQDNCLDKQRVKEAIDIFRGRIHSNGSDYGEAGNVIKTEYVDNYINELLKRLGLEE